MRYQINKREYINLMTHCRNSAESYDGKRMDLLEALEGTHSYWHGEAADTLRCELRAYLESGEYDSMLREYRRVECELELLLPEIRFQMELQDRMSLLLSGQHKAEPEELYLDMEMQEEMLDDLAEIDRQINSSVNEAINAMSDIADIVDLSCDMKDLREKQEDLSIMIRQYSMMSDENMNGVRKADACLCGIFDWIIGNDSDEEEDTPSEVFLDLSKARSHHGVIYIGGKKWEPEVPDKDVLITAGISSVIDSMIEDAIENAIINDDDRKDYVVSILTAGGWSVDDEAAEHIVDVLNDFGISDRNSIAAFLLICMGETGPEGMHTGETGKYGEPFEDKHGRCVTEYYPNYNEIHGDYDYDSRGVGYMQITHREDQRDCYKFLMDREGIELDEKIDNYVDILRDYPWETAAWRWAIMPSTGDGKTLNEYVTVREGGRNGLSLGVLLTAESFINGKVRDNNHVGKDIEKADSTNVTIDDALHDIATGDTLHTKKEDYMVDYKGWYVEETVSENDEKIELLHVNGCIYEAPNNWGRFEELYIAADENGCLSWEESDEN